jgi:hypothetical protein
MQFSWRMLLLLGAFSQAFGMTVTQSAGCTSGVSGLTSTIDFGTSPANATDPAGHATYTTPFFNQGTNPNCGGSFLSLWTDQSTTVTFDQPLDYFGMVWGSPDPYNSLQVFDGLTLLGTFSGTTGGTNNGDPHYVNFFAGSGEQITRLVFSTTSCCFETDNHSYRLVSQVSSPVPEPGEIVPLALVAGLALVARFRKPTL